VGGIGFQAAANPNRQLKTVWPQACQYLSGGRSATVESADRGRDAARRRNMKPGKTDKAEGKLHEVKGKLKEALGSVSNDAALESEGKDENLSGKIQKKIGQIKEVFDK
jgi:uncharacterized protein YjbJ (UPF0337 family)